MLVIELGAVQQISCSGCGFMSLTIMGATCPGCHVKFDSARLVFADGRYIQSSILQASVTGTNDH